MKCNVAKTREALEHCMDTMCAMCSNVKNCEIWDKHPDSVGEGFGRCEEFLAARAALDAPARNCDVGTVEEQAERYHNFTGRHNPCAYNGNARCAEDCPVHIKLTQEGLGELICQLEWAQMPYEAEGDEDGNK